MPSDAGAGADGAAPKIALLTPTWGGRDERGWFVRQVAGALACHGRLEVVTLQGGPPRSVTDGAFTVHEVASAAPPEVVARAELVVTALGEGSTGSAAALVGEAANAPSSGALGSGSALRWAALRQLLDAAWARPWDAASEPLGSLRPDVVVVADHRQAGAVSVATKTLGDVPVILVPLVTEHDAPAFEYFDEVFDRAMAMLVATATEAHAIVGAHPTARPRVVGAPIAANPSVWREPNPYVAGTDYVVVLTPSDVAPEHTSSTISLLPIRLWDHPIAVVSPRTYQIWHGGRVAESFAIDRASDLLRLMAWARATVDVRPGALFARRCVESLLYGTPIVVPDDSRARAHAEVGRGGLWFDGPGVMTWCVEALLRPEVRTPLGHQGQRYAEEHFASTDRFIAGVAQGAGLSDETASSHRQRHDASA